jgi:hypothetical protein
MRWAIVIVLNLVAWSPAHAQTIWEPDPTRDPNTIHFPPGEEIPRYLEGMSKRNCPSGNFVRARSWACVVGYRTLLASPERFYGKDIHIHGFIRVMAGGQLFVMPGDDVKDGYERIRIEGAPSPLPPLKDGDPVFIAGIFGPEDAAHAPGLGVLSNAHDIVVSDEYPDGSSLLPDLRLKTPKAIATAPPKFSIAAAAR